MKKLLFSLFFVGLVSMALTIPFQVNVMHQAQAAAETTITLDLAMDGRTCRVNRIDRTRTDFVRGDTFILNGKLFPAGTIPAGVNAFNPDTPGSLGDWYCTGTIATDDGLVSHVNELFQLNDGNALTSLGLSGTDGRRPMTGGLGEFSDARGELQEEFLGTNTTEFPNLRITFKLK